MNCEGVQDLLPLYLAGELTGEELAAVQHHVEACEACTQSISADRQLDDMLRTAMLEHSPDVSAVLQRVHGEMTASGWKRMLRGRSLRFALLAAMVVLAAALGVSSFRAHQAQRAMAIAAADDHYSDLVLLRHPDWAYQPQDVARFMLKEFPRQDLLATITPRDAVFEKVRLCNLGGTQYAHFVFRTGPTETSVFLVPNVVGNRHGSIHLADAGHGLEASGFSSTYMTGVVVGNKGQVQTQEIANSLGGVL
ncbi:MAG TPA: zf-HC2 domain-containing protein [Candidatus Angelobacter sp.]|nr:zf-HC2 domain-containing protein [Candidatus Angelobacter sp.]